MNYNNRLNLVIPGGAHTYSRGMDQYPANAPQILDKGAGAYIWDEKGNKYLDYGMALRAVTVGYAYNPIAQAAVEQIKKGNNLTRPSLIELEAAETLVDLIPWVDMVKFAKNGSTVTTAALKLARAYTGRDIVVRCTQHPFFSYDDWFIGDTPMDSGIPDTTKSLTLHFNFNEITSLTDLFTKYKDQIAAVILEPATTEEPQNNFLQEVKKLCHDNGTVFILDEMITGFRWDLKGACNYYHIEPDMVTYGKGMANGFSVCALGGKKEIMELGGLGHDKERVFLISTTHGAEMSGLGAFVETVKQYKELDVVGQIERTGKKLIQGMNTIARDLGLEDYFKVVGTPFSPNYMTYNNNGQVSLGLRTLFSQEMINNNVLMPWIAISWSHKELEIEQTLEATKAALKIYKKGVEQGFEKYLVGSVIKPVFRKYN
ncbi:MAG: glutamate-1-semialdehyde 2,1-aminomutase [Bacteroidales bacterium]|nr:glutamate-1-semialdehyde 2,1-aminomutase [Bacteroidales bacterium]